MGIIREETENIGDIENKKEIKEVDYAILKSINYIKDFKKKNINEEIRELVYLLDIRTIIIERHIYGLVKNGFLEFNENVQLTKKGQEEIEKFERESKEWISINDFILNAINQRKNTKSKMYKTIDKILLIIIIIIVITIVYISIFL